MSAQDASATYHSRALDRGLTILGHLAKAKSAGVSLAELHAQTDLPKSTLLRLLVVLERRGFVRGIDNGARYSIGHAVFELAEQYRESADISELAAPYLEALAAETNQTANLGMLDGDSVLHIVVREPERALRFRSTSGSRDSVHCTGLGKMLLAGLASEEARKILSRTTLEPRTEHTLTTVDALMKDITATQKRRFAVDDEEGAEGVCCLAVPLSAPDAAPGRWTVSMSLSGPVGEMSGKKRDRLLATLEAFANQMTASSEFLGALTLAGRS